CAPSQSTSRSAGELACDEAVDRVDRVEVGRDHFVRRHRDLVALLKEKDQLMDTGRIDDAAADQRVRVAQRILVFGEQEVLEYELLDPALLFHFASSPGQLPGVQMAAPVIAVGVNVRARYHRPAAACRAPRRLHRMVHVLANNAMQRLSMLPLLLIALAGCGHDAPAAAVPPRFVADPVPEPYRSEQADFAVTTLVTGLVHPWGLAFLPDGGMLVTERPGRLRLIDKGGQISGPLEGVPRVFVEGQGGLLDVALSPDFGNDRLVYLSFAGPSLRGNLAGTAVARGRLEEGALRDVAVVYRQEPKLSAGTHLGSRLVFDDDGYLFVTQGEHRVAASA